MNPEDTKASILGVVQYLNASPHTLSRGPSFFLPSSWAKCYTCVYVLKEEPGTVRALVQLRSILKVQHCHRN